MAPSEFSLQLKHGIAGGFAPPTPSAIYTITAAAGKPSLLIGSAVRQDGTSGLQGGLTKSLSISDSETALVDELHKILKSIPTESPPGSQDIYGLNTSIAWGSDDLEWVNGGPQGCGGGVSDVQPTADQKKDFARAVDIIKQLVDKAEVDKAEVDKAE